MQIWTGLLVHITQISLCRDHRHPSSGKVVAFTEKLVVAAGSWDTLLLDERGNTLTLFKQNRIT